MVRPRHALVLVHHQGRVVVEHGARVVCGRGGGAGVGQVRRRGASARARPCVSGVCVALDHKLARDDAVARPLLVADGRHHQLAVEEGVHAAVVVSPRAQLDGGGAEGHMARVVVRALAAADRKVVRGSRARRGRHGRLCRHAGTASEEGGRHMPSGRAALATGRRSKRRRVARRQIPGPVVAAGPEPCGARTAAVAPHTARTAQARTVAALGVLVLVRRPLQVDIAGPALHRGIVVAALAAALLALVAAVGAVALRCSALLVRGRIVQLLALRHWGDMRRVSVAPEAVAVAGTAAAARRADGARASVVVIVLV
mmetsp:Transcript_9135/g.25097  ORF Transcript_9135/g.25097 Transcript_9135/m.25097 type:complete len:314 (+) Transcript_9135:966-1907(+)